MWLHIWDWLFIHTGVSRDLTGIMKYSAGIMALGRHYEMIFYQKNRVCNDLRSTKYPENRTKRTCQEIHRYFHFTGFHLTKLPIPFTNTTILPDCHFHFTVNSSTRRWIGLIARHHIIHNKMIWTNLCIKTSFYWFHFWKLTFLDTKSYWFLL